MTDYVLSCCSTCDMSPEWHARRDILCVFFNYELDGIPCKDDYGATHAPADLYGRMLAGAEAKTSQVSVGEYLEAWRPVLEGGRDVLHVTLSSGISGTYYSACTAREALEREFPGRTVIVVDSLAASSGYGLLVDRMADLRDSGMGLRDLAAWAETHKLEVQHWFFSTDLTFFIRGGRISKAAGFFGGLLHICPVMDVEPDGSLAVKETIRSKHKATLRVAQIMQLLARDGADYDGKVFVSNSECLPDAMVLAQQIEGTFAKMDGSVEHFPIGATIGTHTGPGTVALFYWGKPRVDNLVLKETISKAQGR